MVRVTYKKIANLKGDKGDRGDKGATGTFAHASASSLAADKPASVSMSGPESNRSVHFGIPRGMPGVNAVANDEATATYIRGTDTNTGNALFQTVESLSLYDLRRFLEPGEEMPSDITSLMRTARAAAIEGHARTGAPVQIYIPAGDYILSGDIEVASGVGVRGAGQNATRVTLTGSARFQFGNLVGEGNNASGNVWMEDNIYEDLWIDSTVTASSYTSTLKHFFVQNMRRPIWRRLRLTGGFATCLGCDFIVDGLMADLKIEDFGRGHGAPKRHPGTGAAIGIGVGRTPDERCTIRDVVIDGGNCNGVFVERLDRRGATLMTQEQVIMHNVVVKNAPVGVSDCGAGGIVAERCSFEFTDNGWIVGNFGQAAELGMAGRSARVIGCSFVQKGTPTQGSRTGSAFFFESGTNGGGYVIDDPYFSCEKNGIVVIADYQMPNGIEVRLARGQQMGGSLLRVQQRGVVVSKLWVSGALSGWGMSDTFNTRSAVYLDCQVRDARLFCDSYVVGNGHESAYVVEASSITDFKIPPRIMNTTVRGVATPAWIGIPEDKTTYITGAIRDDY